jgi:uncharacterized protein (DUF608 family)
MSFLQDDWPTRRRYARHIRRREHLRAVAMPLGGLGTGSLALCGDGSLRQWQINNQINHLACVPHSFFGVWVQPAGVASAPVARVLQADARDHASGPFPPPTSSDHLVPEPTRALLEALPGVASIEFIGEYPIGEVRYEDAALPVEITLEAFNPFIPLDSRDSGLPAVLFNFHVLNPTATAARVALLATLQNFVGWDGLSDIVGTANPGYGGNTNTVERQDGLTAILMTNPRLPSNDEHFGSLALAAFSDKAEATQWDSPEGLWGTFAADGMLPAAGQAAPSPAGQTWNAALGVPLALGPGEARSVGFAITWHFPNRCFDYGNEHYVRLLGHQGPAVKYRLGNQYNRWFASAGEVLAYVRAHLERLCAQTRLARDTLFATTLPPALVEAVTGQISVMRSPVCFWTEDGRFYGFEGGAGASTPPHNHGGSCPLNCTHVWNYAMAVARLYPALERNMRATEWQLQQHAEGWLPHRVPVPLDLPRPGFESLGGPRHPALDGLLGAVLKTYREYRASGDTDWLAEMWPGVRRALSHLWAVHDQAQTGVIWGEQPNTYDISVYGANTFIGTLYLAALRAAEQMAVALDQLPLAQTCRDVFARGSAALDAGLWNGEYYEQAVNLAEHPENNWVSGCHADQLLGQWWAYRLGMGELLPAPHLRAAAQAIVRHNFRRGFGGHQQQPRVFVSDDDHGLLNCTWPHGGRPDRPTPYSDEVWTGIEYAVAALLLDVGEPGNAVRLVEAARARYDGRKQNPWNDIECGDHYVRAMSAWSLLEAAAGFDYDAGAAALSLAPALTPEDFQAPFVVRDGWGSFWQSIRYAEQVVRLHVTHGSLTLRQLRLRVADRLHAAGLTVAGQTWPAGFSRAGVDVVAGLGGGVTLAAGQTLEVTFSLQPDKLEHRHAPAA